MQDVLEIALALVVSTAAVSKLIDYPRWRQNLGQYRMSWIDSRAVAASVPFLELAIGILLILGVEPLAGAAAMCLFAAFAIVLALAYGRGARGNCDCFGDLLPSTISRAAIIRAGLLGAFGAALVVAPEVSTIEAGPRAAIVVVLTLALTLVGQWRSVQRLA